MTYNNKASAVLKSRANQIAAVANSDSSYIITTLNWEVLLETEDAEEASKFREGTSHIVHIKG